MFWKYRNSKRHQIYETGPLHLGSPDLEESLGTFFTILLPIKNDSKDFEHPRLSITKESRRDNSESQNLLCYKNQTKKTAFHWSCHHEQSLQTTGVAAGFC